MEAGPATKRSQEPVKEAAGGRNVRPTCLNVTGVGRRTECVQARRWTEQRRDGGRRRGGPKDGQPRICIARDKAIIPGRRRRLARDGGSESADSHSAGPMLPWCFACWPWRAHRPATPPGRILVAVITFPNRPARQNELHMREHFVEVGTDWW